MNILTNLKMQYLHKLNRVAITPSVFTVLQREMWRFTMDILSVFRLKSKCEGPQPLRISSASSVIRQHFTTMQSISHGAWSSPRFIDGIRFML